jgi:hypothetical protein
LTVIENMSQGQKRTPETSKRFPQLAEDLCASEQNYDQMAKQFLAAAKIAKEFLKQRRDRKVLPSARRYTADLKLLVSAEVPRPMRWVIRLLRI